VCSYGQTVLENENKSSADGNETRRRLARRLSEVDQGPESPNVVVALPHGSEGIEMPFVSSIRIIIFEDMPDVMPSKSSTFLTKVDMEQCMWDAYHAGEVSYMCGLKMNDIEVSRSIIGAEMLENIEDYEHVAKQLLLNFIICFVAISMCMFTCYRSSDDEEEMDVLDISGNEYYEMSENTMMESVHTGVPLTMTLRVV